MRNLLIKEFKLTGSTLTYIFLAFAAMTMIPGYPILVGTFFICLGIFYTFQFAREYNDVIYTALLPVAKSDVVRARFMFVVTIEMVAFFLNIVLTLIRMFTLTDVEPYVNNPLMNANLIYLGAILVIFALYNLIFVTGFFKTAFYYGKPFVGFIVIAFIFIGIMETLHHLPGLAVLNTCGFEALGVQLAALAGGVLIFVGASIYALRKSIRLFEKIDLSF